MYIPLLAPQLKISIENPSLLKINNVNINVPRRPKYSGVFTGNLDFSKMEAVGFNLKPNQDEYSSLSWSFVVKMINSSDREVVITSISACLQGNTPDHARSVAWLTRVFLKSKGEEERNGEMLPISIKPHSNQTAKVSLHLNTMVKSKFGKDKQRIFKKDDIKMPETCRSLYTKVQLDIKTSAGKISMKFPPMLYVGDVLSIPTPQPK